MASRCKNVNEAKREWIRRHPCVCCGKWPSECSHLKHGVHKDDDAMGPMCRDCHQTLHNKGLRHVEREHHIDYASESSVNDPYGLKDHKEK